MTAIVTSAAEAFDRYHHALEADLLIQAGWHKEEDGRQLACALGVLGDDVNKPRDCPASVMPRWLAQMVPWFFDRMAFDDAKRWGLELDWLRGRDLQCWCPLGSRFCHVDIIIDRANRPREAGAA
jgi:hypothetical protein